VIKKKYVLILEIELSARDDVEAREIARATGGPMFGSQPNSWIGVKLQERFDNKAPRHVVFNPYK